MNKICAGGCAAANVVHTGSIYYQDYTNCEAARISYKHAMLLHDELTAEHNELFLRKFYDTDYVPGDSFSSTQ